MDEYLDSIATVKSIDALTLPRKRADRLACQHLL